MKFNYGITSKMGAYIAAAQRNGDPVILHTCDVEKYGERRPYVYIINGFIAARVPVPLYAEALQPYTHTDAPALGETKTVAGTPRDGKFMAETVAKMMDGATKLARTTAFSCRSKDDKYSLEILALDDGTPVLLDQKKLALFDTCDATLYGENSFSPLVIRGVSIDALVMPVRMDAGRKQTFDAICQAAVSAA